MPSETTVVAPGRSQTNHTNTPAATTDPDGEDQGATDEVITYGDEGENEGEMEMGTVVGMGGNGDIITQSSDLMADIKNSLVNETNANNNLESQTINGLNLKDLGLRHFDAARLAASGLTSLAAAVSGVNGVTTAAAMGMGGLSFNPYSHLPPPLLPYSHLTAATKLYNPFAGGITGLQLPPPSSLDPKAAQTGISSGALSANNSTSDLSATGGSSQQAGNAQNQLGTVSTSNVTASSSPLQTVATSSAPYNTAAAALSNWAAVVSPQNGRLHVPPNGLSPNSLANLNQIHGNNSSQNGSAAAANASSLAMFAQMFNGGRPASGPGSNSAGAAVTSNPYHHLLSLNAAAAAVVASGNDPNRNAVAPSHNGFQRTLPNGGSVASPGGPSGIMPHPPNLLVNSHSGDALLGAGHHQSGGAAGGHGNIGPHGEMMDHAQMKGKLSAMKPSKPYVKKPLNAFMLFMKENREKVMQESTLKESAAINQILGRKWHQLEKNEQNRYYDMAKNERLAHQRLHPNWSARDNYATSKHRRRRKRNMPGMPGEPGSGDYPPDVLGGPNGSGRMMDGPEMHNIPDHLGGGLMPPAGPDHAGLMPGAVMQNHSMLSGLLHHRGASTTVGGSDHQSNDVRDTTGAHLNMSSTVSSSSDSHNISSDSVEAPESASKKCRARFGLDQQESWCKHCRRKKKCSVFIDNDDANASTHGSNSAAKEKRGDILNPKQKLNLPVVPHDVRTNRVANDEGDESPGFNTDSMISIKNDLVNSLSENSGNLDRSSHYVIPPKKARSDLHVNSENSDNSATDVKLRTESADTFDDDDDDDDDDNEDVVVETVSEKLKNEPFGNDTETESDEEGEENRDRREVQRDESSESEDCLSASDLKESKQKDVKLNSENSPISSLVSNKLPLSLQGQILSNLNNNHISSSAAAHATNNSMMQQTSQSIGSVISGNSANSSRASVVHELPPSSKTDANVLSPLLELHNNVLQNSNPAAVAASLGAITNQIKMESANAAGAAVRTDPASTSAKTSSAPASSIAGVHVSINSSLNSAISGTPSSSAVFSGASAVPSSLILSNGLPFTTAATNAITPGHIPFAFSPFTPTVFTSVSNSTTPNSPFSPLQPTSAAAVAAAAAFGAGSIFASAPGANGSAPATAAGLPFTSFFGPTGFPGSPFSAAFKDPKEIMASMALASGSTTAAASQS